MNADAPRPRSAVDAFLLVLAVLAIPVALATALLSGLAVYGGVDAATGLRTGIIALVVAGLVPMIVLIAALIPAGRVAPRPWTNAAAIALSAIVLGVVLLTGIPRMIDSIGDVHTANQPLDDVHSLGLTAVEFEIDALVDASVAVVPGASRTDHLSSYGHPSCTLPNEDAGGRVSLIYYFPVDDPTAAAADVRDVWERAGYAFTENGSKLEGTGELTFRVEIATLDGHLRLAIDSVCTIDDRP